MMEEHTFDTGTVAINYAEGPPSGLPLVLLHGGGASWHSLLTVIPDFIHTWHIYALDFRGHGRSGRVPGAYRWVDYVQDTTAFLRPRLLYFDRLLMFGHIVAKCCLANKATNTSSGFNPRWSRSWTQRSNA